MFGVLRGRRKDDFFAARDLKQQQAARLRSELEAIVIFVTLRKTFQLAVLLIATEI